MRKRLVRALPVETFKTGTAQRLHGALVSAPMFWYHDLGNGQLPLARLMLAMQLAADLKLALLTSTRNLDGFSDQTVHPQGGSVSSKNNPNPRSLGAL